MTKNTQQYVPCLFVEDGVWTSDRISNCPNCGRLIQTSKAKAHETPICYKCYANMDDEIRYDWLRIMAVLFSISLFVILISALVNVFWHNRGG